MANVKNSVRAFTLIELLIVVAIIAILAAIAVPNFLEAQTRAKVARCKSDLRTISIALESYMVDANRPPHLAANVPANGDVHASNITRNAIASVTNLTTPIAYLTSVNMLDPFASQYSRYNDDPLPMENGGQNSDSRYITYHYLNIWGYNRADGSVHGWGGKETNSNLPANWNFWSKYALISLGPDYLKGPDPQNVSSNQFYLWYYGMQNRSDQSSRFATYLYDPSNGTKSGGDILRFQGQ